MMRKAEVIHWIATNRQSPCAVVAIPPIGPFATDLTRRVVFNRQIEPRPEIDMCVIEVVV
jgi:hypothetical protein